MAELYDIDHETGDLSQYDSTVTDGGDLSVTAAAALAGTGHGLSCLIDDTNRIYGVKDQADPGTGKFRCRFYSNPNTLAMPNNTYFYVFFWHSTAAANYVFIMSFRRIAAGDYRLYFQPYNDAGILASINKPLSGEQYLEIYIVQASNAVAADGSVEWWIDGVSQDTWNNVDNFDCFANADFHRLGAASKPAAGTTGTFFLDQLYANDDGSEIGPYVAAVKARRSRPVFRLEGIERLRSIRRYSIY